MKNLLRGALLLCLAALAAWPQSLVDLSRAERERRERYRGRPVVTVTNKDLTAWRERQGFPETPVPETPAQGAAPWPGERSEETGGRILPDRRYATSVLTETAFVLNPREALGAPDGLYAYVQYGGFLDLDLEAVNGTGYDVAIFARRPPVGFVPEFYAYEVLGSPDGLEWYALGRGDGTTSPEYFDLGDLEGIRMLRIAYRQPTDLSQQLRRDRLERQDYSMGVDAVESVVG